ncbi:MAG: hypothetical protein ACTSYA_07885 [Candidatus Kariarchaeaceae archaeon]
MNEKINSIIPVNLQIFGLKFIHSLIMLYLTFSTWYILYCGIVQQITDLLLISIIIMAIEGVGLIPYNFKCPLAVYAENLGSEDGRVTQYFFPQWFVPHVFKTYFAMIIMGLSLLFLGNLGVIDQPLMLK